MTDPNVLWLIKNLDYQTEPGVHKVKSCGWKACKNKARSQKECADCTDAALLDRGVDITEGGSQYAYERIDGRIRRKIKGA